MLDPYGWVVFAHVMAIIVSLGAHGASAVAMFMLRSERDRVRMTAILDVSGSSLLVAGLGLLLGVVLGIIAAVMGGHFANAWPWAAIGLSILVIGLMTPLAGIPMNDLRKTLGMRVQGDKPTDPPRVPGTDAEVTAAAAALRPWTPLVIGVGGIAILTWLMEAKPF